jgi:beta-lactamase class A
VINIFSASIYLSTLLSSPDLSRRSTPILVAQMQISPQAALERLFTTPKIERQWFADDFLSKIPVPPEQVIRDLQTNLGAFQRLQPEGEGYRLVFERGSLAALIVLDRRGQITGLLFQDVRSNGIALPEAITQLKALPGQVTLLVAETTGGTSTDLAALNVDQPLAVGSAFKLAVLAALRQDIQANRRAWQDVVTLQTQDKSLPSGVLHTWYEGAWLTLQTLATLMISQSDNTATDVLIHRLGREPIEALTPRNRPFLTTRELFVLKASKNASLLQRYRQGTATQRRQLLPVLAQAPLPGFTELSDRPLALDVEWFFTPRELCQLMSQVADLPLMSVNPGSVNPQEWQRVAFKGGSEPGVLNLTTDLVSKQGKRYCVSATWNNLEAAVDEERFVALYNGMIAGLQR